MKMLIAAEATAVSVVGMTSPRITLMTWSYLARCRDF